MKILVIDNYDSFVYNLVHYLEELDCEVVVKRNDELMLKEVEEYDKILLSPGPGIPDEAGLLKAVIERYAPTKSIFGVCLGQQAIAEVFGGKIINLDKVYHGLATEIEVVDNDVIYENLPQKIDVGRYHSWIVSKDLPDELVVTAVDGEGQIMSLKHKEYNVYAVQYHPESVLTPQGKKIIENWVKNC